MKIKQYFIRTKSSYVIVEAVNKTIAEETFIRYFGHTHLAIENEPTSNLPTVGMIFAKRKEVPKDERHYLPKKVKKVKQLR